MPDLENADDIVLLSKDPSKRQLLFGHLNDSVDTFGMCFASSNYEMLTHHWIGSEPNLVAAR